MKKSVLCLLSAILLFTFTTVPVCADSDIHPIKGVYGEEDLLLLTLDEQYNNFQSLPFPSIKRMQSYNPSFFNDVVSKYEFMSLSESERTEIVRSAMQSNKTSTTSVRSSLSLPQYSCILNVPHFEQERGYWCGPATLKQTIHFLTNGAISPTQSSLASNIGTTTAGSSSTNMANWLGQKGFAYYSVAVNTMSFQDIENYVYSAIEGYKVPVFGGIAVYAGNQGEWPYTTSGHLLNLSGIHYDAVSYHNDYFEFTDPFITCVTSAYPDGKYEISIEDYKAVMTSFWW